MPRQRKFLNNMAFAVLALALVVIAAVPALAQTDVTTSRISGQVKDAEGGVLPGVTVEARNTETGLLGRAVTDGNGSFKILNLPTGTYTVSADLQGFAKATREVRLVLGSAPTVDFSMQLASVAEQITVTAQVPLVEVTNTTAGTTILTEQLATLPLNGRNFTDLVYLTPETNSKNERNYISISGQRGINTNVTIDGVDNNNAFFGGVTGDAEGRAPLSVSKESIKEFTVVTNGASAEFGRSAGGFVNAITKSGTNDLHGSAFYYYQPESMVADFPTGYAKPQDMKKKQYGASLGTPIVKDRLFFFGSYDQQKQSVTVPISAAVLDSAVFAKWPILSSDPAYVQGRDGKVIFGRLDWMAANGHRVMARANYADYLGENGTSAASTRTESFNGLEMMFSRSYVANYSAVFGQNLINDLNVQYVIEDTPRADKGLGLPEIQVTSGGLRYGEVGFLPITSKNTRKQIADSLSYVWNDHVVKFGFDYNKTDIDQIFKGNWRGVFIFSTKADLIAGKWSEYRQFGGLNGLTADQAGQSAFAQKETALFLQDQWYVSPTLTMSVGLRWEKLDNPNIDILNMNDRNANGSFNLTSQIPDVSNQWSPRLGITWAPTQKMAIKFSAGRFWSRTPGLLWAQANTANGYRATQYIMTAGASGPTDPLASYVGWGSTWNPSGIERIPFAGLGAVAKPGVFTVADNYTNAHTDRFTLEYQQEILANTSVTLGATYAKSKDLEYITDANLQYACADGTVGLTCTPALASNGLPKYSSTKPYPYYGRISVIASGAESKYFGLTSVIQRRFAERLSGILSVTWSKDKDHDSNERNYAGLNLEDKRDLSRNWGYSGRDQRWKIGANATWNTPWWGIDFSGLFRYSTGTPYSGIANSDLNGDGDRFTDLPTVDGVHSERNSFRQPDFWSADLRLAKKIKVGPGDISVIAECFNVTDEQYFYISGTTWGTGSTPAAGWGAETYGGTPRTFQFALRYDF